MGFVELQVKKASAVTLATSSAPVVKLKSETKTINMYQRKYKSTKENKFQIIICMVHTQNVSEDECLLGRPSSVKDGALSGNHPPSGVSDHMCSHCNCGL
jgi:hypothetical protein